MKQINLENISLTYEGTDQPILDHLSTTLGEGWTGIVGVNGCGKSTLLKILHGDLQPSSGRVVGTKGLSQLCQQETILEPPGIENFRESYDKDTLKLKDSLGLYDLEYKDWNTLSHGERKRMQLGLALSQSPHLLLLDEPTNHLDTKNREVIARALKMYRGIGVLVSHDRELLDMLCQQCIVFQGSQVMTIPGNYSEAKATIDQDTLSKQKRASDLKALTSGLQREANRLKSIGQGSKNRQSKKGIHSKDHDAKTKIDLSRITNKDSSLDQKKLNIERRISNANEEIQSLKTDKSYANSIFFVPRKSHKKTLLQLSPQVFPNSNLSITVPSLDLRSGDKVGITGLNGVGKSTFIKHLIDHHAFKTDAIFYLQQELASDDKLKLKSEFQTLDKEAYSKCLQIIARLGSDAKQIMSSESLSSGEIRKIAISLAIVKEVDLLILDEPTNHLDIHSILSLEEALSLCNIALLIISHDRLFIESICSCRWHFTKLENKSLIEKIYD